MRPFARIRILAAVIFMLLSAAGCGPSPLAQASKTAPKLAAPSRRPKKAPAPLPTARHSKESEPSDRIAAAAAPEEGGAPKTLESLNLQTDADSRADPSQRRAISYAPPQEPDIPPERLQLAGIRLLRGTRLLLYTDVVSSQPVDELPKLFDAAIPQCAESLGISVEELSDWKVIGCLIKNKTAFESVGLLPPGLPDFKYAFTRYDHFWLYDQSSEYYRRHLLLHEGVHTLTHTLRPSIKQPWIQEGLAELFATHEWKQGELTLAWMPQTTESAPGWGRIEMIQRAYSAGKGLPTEHILHYGNTAHLEVEPYAWCWALSTLLHSDPRWSQQFRDWLHASRDGELPDFLETLEAEDRATLHTAWRLFVSDLDYGYSLERSGLKKGEASPLSRPTEVKVQADQGWQPSGVYLEEGKSYRLKANGQTTLATTPGPWISEPPGVTADYYRGRPVGELHGMLLNSPPPPSSAGSEWSDWFSIGAETECVVSKGGQLYLKVNESPGRLSDNTGDYTVTISPQ